MERMEIEMMKGDGVGGKWVAQSMMACSLLRLLRWLRWRGRKGEVEEK